MQRLLSDSRQGQIHEKSVAVKLLVIVAVGIFVVSLGLSLWILRPSEGMMVDIVSDGETLYTIDLTEAENQEIVIFYDSHDNSDSNHGSSNTIQIENGEIWVKEAQCPDQTCVKMGKLYSESLPIVCLPNRLTIRYAE